MNPQQASIQTRVKIWFDSIPLITRSVLVICVGVYIINLLTGYDDHAAVCLNPYTLVQRLQLYRLFTSAIFHAGLLHIGFNMLAFVPIATSLERQLGSLQMLHLLLILVLLGDVFYIAASYLAALLLVDAHKYLASCAIGLSGAIFGLIVVDNACSNVQTRSIFGMFTVPAKWYPWALLVFWQLLMPGVSFLGHLGGVLAGQAYVWGWLRWLTLSTAAYQAADGWRGLDWCRRWDCYIAHTGVGNPSGMQLPTSYNASVQADSGLAGAFRRPAAWLPSGWPSPGAPGGAANSAGRSPAGQAGSSAGGPGQAGTGGPFKGRGHTLGGTPTVPPASAAAAAAAARMARDGGSRNGGGNAGVRADGKGKEPVKPASTIDAGVMEAGVQQLVSMGFDRGAATTALTAANGDVSAALEKLSV
ncbi:probable rhomboid-related protein 4 at N-terminal half [Coccomyxa sp. Obi]|nr:probable rhomboid-related protein 4 at N-terminal half [Coccomyxa sp. Obi]